MADVRRVLETRKNGLKVNLFEFDIENEEKFSNLKEYLINKVKRSGVHNIEEYNLTYYGSKNLNPAFVAKFNEQVAQINIPKRAVIPQFDVRRERVTEWMAQHLLEQVYGCTFYDEADKRLNLKTVEIDKHTDGIDVQFLHAQKLFPHFFISQDIPVVTVGIVVVDALQLHADAIDQKLSLLRNFLVAQADFYGDEFPCFLHNHSVQVRLFCVPENRICQICLFSICVKYPVVAIVVNPLGIKADVDIKEMSLGPA